jgi:carbon storage regulator CsrA
VGESIIVGGDIVVTVIEVGRGRIQLGVVAPPNVTVYRNEIVERMIARGEIDSCDALDRQRSLTVG